MVSKQTPSQKKNSQKMKTKKQSAAETVIEGQLAGTHALSRLRQISPVTVALICAVLLALGLSLWPYLAPLFISSSDDGWRAETESRLSQLRADVQMLSKQQAALTGQLMAVQNNLSALDQQIKDTASAVVKLSDALTADIERLDTQSARFSEQMASLTSFGLQQDKPKKPANNAASSDTQPEAGSLLQHLPELAVPDLSLPSVSGWWQRIAGWFGGLVSVERVQPEREQQ